MKTKIVYIMALFAAVMLSGCEKESSENFGDTQVKIAKANVNFLAEGGTGTIEIAASEGAVTAKSDQDWCVISLSGNIITVTTTPNTNNTSRTALITVNAGKKVNYVPVTQEPFAFHLDNYNPISFEGKSGSEYSLSYTLSMTVPVTVNTDSASWLSATVTDNEIILTTNEYNPKFVELRTGQIKLIAGDQLIVIPMNVVQQGSITVNEPDPDFDAVAAFKNLKNNSLKTVISSSYRVTAFCPRVKEFYDGLIAGYPTLFQGDLRVETPRNANTASIFLFYVNASNVTYAQYWNGTTANNGGLNPVAGPAGKYTAVFVLDTNTQTNSPSYTSNTNYTRLRAFFVQGDGFVLLPDPEIPNAFWFRSVADPTDYFQVTPAVY